MKKSKMLRYVLNGSLLAVITALGITIYQIGTIPVKEQNDLFKQNEIKNNIETKEGNDDIINPQYVEMEENTETEVVSGKNVEDVEILDKKDQDSVDNISKIVEENQGIEAGIDVDGELTDVVSSSIVENLSFSDETLMEWPVHGNILIDYSMNQSVYFATLDQYRLSPAISIQAVENAPVVAAVKGKVYSIKEDSKTGTTVTMEIGSGYQMIYGQLKDLAVYEGQTVEKGVIIGYVDVPTKYYNLEGSNLYFGMKKDGKPIDPIIYLP